MINAIVINESAPYKVIQSTNSSVQFATEQGTLYEVGFVQDLSLGIDGVFQFFITNVNNSVAVRDEKIRDTVWAVLENFFTENEYAMLYICDVSDGRQTARNRLFRMWFSEYANHSLYKLLTAEASYMGEQYFASLIIKRTNPYYAQYSAKFDEFERNLKNKLNE
ncbi:MAG: DUF6169 family protein [Bacteroidales bacterium]|nr:DUF6169 family protein [Bacteroidales bacterium]